MHSVPALQRGSGGRGAEAPRPNARAAAAAYEAPSPDELIAAARRAGIPADVIVEVNRVSPEMVA
jgi:hypothetical protein